MVLEFFYVSILFVTKDHVQIFKTVAFLLLGYFGKSLKFTPQIYHSGGLKGGINVSKPYLYSF